MDDIKLVLDEFGGPLRDQPRQAFRLLEAIFNQELFPAGNPDRTKFCKRYTQFIIRNESRHRLWVAQKIQDRYEKLLEQEEEFLDRLHPYTSADLPWLHEVFDQFKSSKSINFKDPEAIERLGELSLFTHLLQTKNFELQDWDQTFFWLASDGWPRELFKGELDRVFVTQTGPLESSLSMSMDERREYFKIACLNDEPFSKKLLGTALIYAGWRNDQLPGVGIHAPRNWWRLANKWIVENWENANKEVPSSGDGSIKYSDLAEAQADKGTVLVKSQRTGKYLPKNFS